MERNKFINILLLVIMLAVLMIGSLSVSTAMTLIRINTTEDKLRNTLVQREQTIGRQRAEIDSLKQDVDRQRIEVRKLSEELDSRLNAPIASSGEDIKQKQIKALLKAVREGNNVRNVRAMSGHKELSDKQKQAITWLLDSAVVKEDRKTHKFIGNQNYDYDVMRAHRISHVLVSIEAKMV